MLAALNGIIDIISAAWNFVSSIIENLVKFFVLALKCIYYLTTCFTFIPGFLWGFTGLFLSAMIIKVVVNR